VYATVKWKKGVSGLIQQQARPASLTTLFHSVHGVHVTILTSNTPQSSIFTVKNLKFQVHE